MSKQASIIIQEIAYAPTDKLVDIQCQLGGGIPKVLNYQIASDYCRELIPFHGEFAIMACLPKAMLDNRDIYVLNIPVDPVFLSNMEHYQERMLAPPEATADEWLGLLPNTIYPQGYDTFARKYKGQMHQVEIHAPVERITGASDKYRVGTLASAGVDSTYTMLGIRELTDIIHIDNMNWPNNEASLKLIKMLRPDLRLHQVHAANFYYIPDSEFWIFFSHGVLLASVGLLFSEYLTSIVTSGTDRAPGIDMGSGHDIDYLWSSSRMRFYSYGNIPRFKKIEFFGNHPQGDTILQNLQTCSDAPKRGDLINCSRCWKCVYTMTLIDACGLRERATAFDYSHFVEDFDNYPMPNDYSMLMNMPLILDGYKKTGNTDMLHRCQAYVERSQVKLEKLYKYSWSPTLE